MNKSFSFLLVIVIACLGAWIVNLHERLNAALSASAVRPSDRKERLAPLLGSFDGVAGKFRNVDAELRRRYSLVDPGDPLYRFYREAIYIEYSVFRSLNWSSDLIYLCAVSSHVDLPYVLSRLKDLAADIENSMQISEGFLSACDDPFIRSSWENIQEYGREGLMVITHARDQIGMMGTQAAGS